MTNAEYFAKTEAIGQQAIRLALDCSGVPEQIDDKLWAELWRQVREIEDYFG